MFEMGNERQRDRVDVPRGYGNIKSICERRLALQRGTSRPWSGAKLRESGLEVLIQVVAWFLRVVPTHAISFTSRD